MQAHAVSHCSIENAIMALHLRGYRLRCYPNRDQRELLPKLFGARRWVWNQCLQARTRAYADPELTEMFGHGLRISSIDFDRALTQVKQDSSTSWLAAVDSGVLTQALRDQDAAFARFFAGRAKYPRYKRRSGHCESIRFVFSQRHAGKVRAWNEGRLVLPQLGEVRVVWSRRPDVPPKMVTLSRDAAGRYFVSMVVREEIETLPASTECLGIDVGVKDLAVLSDGTKIANARKLQGKLRHLRRLSRALARKKKGSGRWQRARRRLAGLHARINDARRDALHQASASVIHRAGLIAIEELDVRNMMRNRKLSRALSDASVAEFHRQLEYKAKWSGRLLVRAGRWEPTSQLCSSCNHRNRGPRLRQRRWSCPSCGADHDRDVNAARNILASGLRTIAGSGVGQGVPDLKRVEGGNPTASASAG